MTRRYLVSIQVPGADEGTPVAEVDNEYKAIVKFRQTVVEACSLAVDAGRMTFPERKDLIQRSHSVMEAQLKSLRSDEGIYLALDSKSISIRLLDEVSDPVVEAVNEAAFDRADDAMGKIATACNEGDLAEATRVLVQIEQDAAREEAIQSIARLFQYARENFQVLPQDMTEFDKGFRAAWSHAILTAAGVPYAVVGQMRPSLEWQTAFGTVKMLILDAGLDPIENATWIVDLPKSEPAPATQPDFAEQIRPESSPEGGDTREPNTWFQSNSGKGNPSDRPN